MAGDGQSAINAIWYKRSISAWLLLPLSLVYWLVTALRRGFYLFGLFRSFRLDVPVVVVGNLTVGGTGKTPVTIWLVKELQARGFRPGVVSRGYRGSVGSTPLPVLSHSDPASVGDEPVLIAERCGCPVVVHPDRVAAGRLLIEQGVDVVVSDDGLQHYRLSRDLELCVVDGARGFGNGYFLPAGPLREGVGRLRQIDAVLVNEQSATPSMDDLEASRVERFRLAPGSLFRMDGSGEQALSALSGTRVHAVAAIGNPDRFFATLRSHGLDVIEHPLPDHAALHPSDLVFADERPVIVTEKDAVKCRHIDVGHVWVLPVDADFASVAWLDELLGNTPGLEQAARD